MSYYVLCVYCCFYYLVWFWYILDLSVRIVIIKEKVISIEMVSGWLSNVSV